MGDRNQERFRNPVDFGIHRAIPSARDVKMHVVLGHGAFLLLIHSLLKSVGPLLPAEKSRGWVVRWEHRLAADGGALVEDTRA